MSESDEAFYKWAAEQFQQHALDPISSGLTFTPQRVKHELEAGELQILGVDGRKAIIIWTMGYEAAHRDQEP